MKKVKLFGVLLLALTFGVVGVKALEVETLEEFKNAVEAGGEITLTADLENVDTIVINEGVNVTLDLNGHSITAGLKSTGRHYYAIDNYGTFTLNDSKGTGVISARGIENLGGTMTINGGTIVSIDENGGAAIWNDNVKGKADELYHIRENNFDLTLESDLNYYNELIADDEVEISDFDDEYTYEYSGYAVKNEETGKYYYLYYRMEVKKQGKLYINGGTFRAPYAGSSKDSSGPGCLNSSAYAEIHGGSFISSSNRVYAVISSGEIYIDETKEKVIISGAHGGISVDYGKAVINGGSYSATNYYGIWITNNGNVSDVTINGGTFTGNKYGLYASVDDGRQDVGDVSIRINGGTFTGSVKAAAALSKNSENQWGMIITGGTYSSDISSYVDLEKSYVYTIGDEIEKYVVITNISVDIEDKAIDKNSEDILEKEVTSIIESILKNDETVMVSEEVSNKIKEGLAEGKEVTSKIVYVQLDEEKIDLENFEELKDSKIAGVFDITLSLFADGEQLGNISELNKTIKVTISIPEKMVNADKKIIRTYKMFRIHDGEVKELNTITNEDGTVTFETDKFSEYILTYEDTENADTFDGIISYIVMAIVSLGLVFGASLYLKKRFN